MRLSILVILINTIISGNLSAQTFTPDQYWHVKERVIRYQPDGTDFVIVNGNRRFTRALYGTNTAFRVETGDLPEFGLYMPGMGGNFKFGLIGGDSSKWLNNAARITARYRPGTMLYEIEDPMLGKGKMQLQVLEMADAEGMIIKAVFENVSKPVQLVCVFGGASGKKFSRDGDMGPDPESSFYLKPEYCTDNRYNINKNNFQLNYGSGLVTEWDPYVNKNFASDTVKAVKLGKEQILSGVFPIETSLHIADAAAQSSPTILFQSEKSKAPVIACKIDIKNQTYLFSIQKPGGKQQYEYKELQTVFDLAEVARKKISDRIKITTPDKYINTLGGVLSTAADAIWETPTYMHGAIGWRMRLNGWRGPYVADVLGWHDRAKTHFKAYSLSQLTEPLSGPIIMDTALNLARSLEKLGTSIYSSGYICRNPNGDFRPHHYDMNLVYIDALLRHFKWTGDLSFAKEMWPTITRHLAWEKRNFDPDDDGLYDAYAAIWASDALQYSGGAVTHSSAYNYKSNKEAAQIAKLIGEDGSKYEAEAAKILKGINTTLWMPSLGAYAEFKDLLGNKMLHRNAALWTYYHSVDSDVPDPFQAYQTMKYVDDHTPHIPVRAKGLEDEYQTVSTTNWMPYDWSLNNVATAEVMHTALANWEAGRNEKAFNLYKAELLSTMYLGGSPGNIGQISFYDAARGEAYRDFSDPVAMTARSTIEGLFGIHPDLLKKELLIKPGFPGSWNNASISTPDLEFQFRRNGKRDSYVIAPLFNGRLTLKLLVSVNGNAVKNISVNGKKVNWKNSADAIGTAAIEINAGIEKKYSIDIQWDGESAAPKGIKEFYINEDQLTVAFAGNIEKLFDPQHVLQQVQLKGTVLSGSLNAGMGQHTAFVQLKKNNLLWWEPIAINLKNRVDIIPGEQQSKNSLRFSIVNNTDKEISGKLIVNPGASAYIRDVTMDANSVFSLMNMPQANLVPGSNDVSFTWNEAGKEYSYHQSITNWQIDKKLPAQQQLDLSAYFNDKVSNIFKNKYLSPRPTVATLQLPVQGIGDWTHPLKTADIDDRGLRKLAAVNNEFSLPQGIRFSTPADSTQRNILFTSQWDNFPKEKSIELSGKALHAYLLMAGSTNPMQSRITNGALIVDYIDRTADTLLLKNPESWWPIEQDYMDDGYAFKIDAARPVRVHLKTGRIVSDYDNSIIAYNGKMIEGGAATVLDMPLSSSKTLKSLRLQTWANDVIIGLISLTLIRE